MHGTILYFDVPLRHEPEHHTLSSFRSINLKKFRS